MTSHPRQYDVILAPYAHWVRCSLIIAFFRVGGGGGVELEGRGEERRVGERGKVKGRGKVEGNKFHTCSYKLAYDVQIHQYELFNFVKAVL